MDNVSFAVFDFMYRIMYRKITIYQLKKALSSVFLKQKKVLFEEYKELAWKLRVESVFLQVNLDTKETMKVTGFTFVKNAIIYDYPVVEAIRSILPVCDAFVVAVGKSDDATLELIQGIDPEKITIIETEWDESLREGGRVLAVETDKAFHAIPKDSDWAFYIQGDEVVHEKYLEEIRQNMERYKDDPKVDGLLFNYAHFYGSYDYIGASTSWYSHEIRVIKNRPEIYSYKDAQGFRKGNNEKLNVKQLNAWVYHYGWVKEPEAMQRKQENFNKYWHDDSWVEENIVKADAFDYGRELKELKKFEGTHPEVMLERVKRKNWKFDYDISKSKRKWKDRAKTFLKEYLGIDTGHKNYRLLK